MTLDGRLELCKQASLPYWWCKTRHLDIPQPKTEYIPLGRKSVMGALRAGDIDMKPFLAAAKNVGGYPVFARTDQMACKHEFDATCFVDSADAMKQHLLQLLEINMMMDMDGDVQPDGVAIREFLDLDYSFLAFAGKMPIATEVRVFLRNHSIECVHPYWSHDPIEQWAASDKIFRQYVNDDSTTSGQNHLPEDWQDRLTAQNAKIDRDMDVIRAQAGLVVRAMDGWWSCDMALSSDDTTWYLPDMAPGALSYHLPPCPHVPEDQSS